MCVVELQVLYGKIVDLYMSQPEDETTSFFDDVILPICNKVASSSKASARLAGEMALIHSFPVHKKGENGSYSLNAGGLP